MSHYICERSFEGVRLWRLKEGERGRETDADSLCYTKENLREGGINRRDGEYGERLQIPGVHSSATQPAAMATQLCRNPKVPMLRGKDSDGKEKATT